MFGRLRNAPAEQFWVLVAWLKRILFKKQRPVDNRDSIQINCFIVPQKPKSHNKWKKDSSRGQSYQEAISRSFQSAYPGHQPLTGNLYGTVYYFFKIDLRSDADNISKPVWDCLCNLIYVDDKQVKLRTAGVFDLNKNAISELDITQ